MCVCKEREGFHIEGGITYWEGHHRPTPTPTRWSARRGSQNWWGRGKAGETGLLRGVVDDGLGRGTLRGRLQLVGGVGDGGRQGDVLGNAQQVGQRGQDLHVAAEVHAAGDEASGEQAGDFVRAGERRTRVTAEALLLGPAVVQLFVRRDQALTVQ